MHWDEAHAETVDQGCLRRTRWDLGEAAGSVAVGLKRVRAQPGGQTSPVHTHSAEEEIFFVLEGGGRLWQDGAVCEVAAGDAIVHAGEGPPHTLVAGDAGLDVLAFGLRRVAETGVLPRAGVAWVGDTWVEAAPGEHPFLREAALEPVDVSAVGERPANVVAIADVAEKETRRGQTHVVRRDLGRAAGSAASGLVHVDIAPGAESHPPHCHSAEEELFVVLGGEGVLRLWDEEERPVSRGHVVARPAGTGVAHSWRAGDEGLRLLAYGERDPRDVCWYPRSQKLAIRGVGATFRVERVDYWDGEE